MTDTPKPAATEKPKPETFTPKEDIKARQRGGTFVIVAAAGTPIPIADARRYEKAGYLDMSTGKAPKEAA